MNIQLLTTFPLNLVEKIAELNVANVEQKYVYIRDRTMFPLSLVEKPLAIEHSTPQNICAIEQNFPLILGENAISFLYNQKQNVQLHNISEIEQQNKGQKGL